MTADYTLICIPLDVRHVATSATRFNVHIVADLLFPPGNLDPASIATVVESHPLLCSGGTDAIEAEILDLDTWERNGRSFEAGSPPHRLQLIYAGLQSRASLLRTLRSYLGAAQRPVQVAKLKHDARFDNLKAADFVDITAAYDQTKALTGQLQSQIARNLGARFAKLADLDSLSVNACRWVNGTSKAVLLEAIEGENPRLNELISSFQAASQVSEIRSATAKIRRRMATDKNEAGAPCEDSHTLVAMSDAGAVPVDQADPNVAIHAALKNNLLATACGIVTPWAATSATPLQGDYVMRLYAKSLPGSSADINVIVKSTAIRRRTHTHPLAFADLHSTTTSNCGFAALNDGVRQRYKASSVNTETVLVKEVILQSSNSIAKLGDDSSRRFGDFTATLDTRQPQVLDRFGVSEPETSGVTFSAPIEDLQTPQPLKSTSAEERESKYPCLFFEDLNTGFRLDTARESERKFLSVHRQQQRIALTNSGHRIEGWTEDYFDREQADDPKRGYSSNEITTFDGLTSGQRKDYLEFLGLGSGIRATNGAAFSLEIVDYGNCHPLLFGQVYEYRLRNVFLGGVSVTLDEANATALASDYYQQFPFYRARALRPGEILDGLDGGEKETGGKERMIFLSDKNRRASILVLPTPIDMDTARFHGLLLRSSEEPQRNRSRTFVADLPKHFANGVRSLDYFFDPDVSGIVIRVTMLNGDPDGLDRGYVFEDGSYCEVNPHLHLPPMRIQYGKPRQLESFAPIEIVFSTTNERRPRISRGGFFGGCHRVDITVPEAGDIEVSLLPIVSAKQLRATASYAASSHQYASRPITSTGDEPLQHWIPIPAIAEQLIRVIHAVRRPRLIPEVVAETASPSKKGGTPVAYRELDSELALLRGRVEIEAASTSEVRLEATWKDINDGVGEAFALERGQCSSTAKNVVFQRITPVQQASNVFLRLFSSIGGEPKTIPLPGASNYSFSDQFDLQCAENKVFLSPPVVIDSKSGYDKSTELNFKDTRRKVAQVQGVAVGRYRRHFEGDNEDKFVSRSKLVEWQIPSSVRMAPPAISHIIPLGMTTLTDAPAAGTSVTSYGFRIYVERPWFQSGSGERLAIACASGHDGSKVPVEALDKSISYWGEDPFERPGLPATLRMPRASDFVAADESQSIIDFDTTLYPRDDFESAASVLYRDNLELPLPQSTSTRASVASFALRYDGLQQKWYCDVAIAAQFFGWCGLALYRHQPLALEGRELSAICDWAYAAVLYGDPIAWIERNRSVQVTIGPLYDPNVTFEFDSLEFHAGVSRDISSADRVTLPLRSYRVGRGIYFEGTLPKGNFGWGLLKKRFGFPMNSRRLPGAPR